MNDDDKAGGERVKAAEPMVVQSPVEAPTPADAAARENAIDEATDGDGVTFFEGGDGREGAREDIERSG